MPNNLVFNYSAQQLKVLTNGINSQGDIQPLSVSDSGALNIGAISGNVGVIATDLDIRSLSGATDSVAIAGDVGVVATDLDIRDLSGATDSVTVFANDLDIRSLSGATDSIAIAGNVGIVATDLDIRDLSGATDSVTVAGFTYESTLETLAFTDGQTQATESKLVGGVSFMTYYISNIGAGTLTINYQISPIDTDGYYIKDPLVSEITVGPSEKITIIQGTYSTYGRLDITCAGGASNVEVYYMSRS